MLVPDRMAEFWQRVEAGQMSSEDCVREQERLLEPYRAEWTAKLVSLERHLRRTATPIHQPTQERP